MFLLLVDLIIVLSFQSLASILVSLELIQLYEQIIHILQMLNLVNLLELVDQGQSRHIEHVDLHLEGVAEELNCFWCVILSVEDVEVDITKVDDE